ncbi:hypothetical protein, conserved [Leishmania tarentolae]|uniref:Uncharacterized protein n=1 Tax=Leishmania tarentolae TaxID=5689 RepID=A0A640KPY6_LEITA|nr:hypothetical protein, conserved [Leishmania tarentolae]
MMVASTCVVYLPMLLVIEGVRCRCLSYLVFSPPLPSLRLSTPRHFRYSAVIVARKVGASLLPAPRSPPPRKIVDNTTRCAAHNSAISHFTLCLCCPIPPDPLTRSSEQHMKTGNMNQYNEIIEADKAYLEEVGMRTILQQFVADAMESRPGNVYEYMMMWAKKTQDLSIALPKDAEHNPEAVSGDAAADVPGEEAP